MILSFLFFPDRNLYLHNFYCCFFCARLSVLECKQLSLFFFALSLQINISQRQHHWRWVHINPPPPPHCYRSLWKWFFYVQTFIVQHKPAICERVCKDSTFYSNGMNSMPSFQLFPRSDPWCVKREISGSVCCINNTPFSRLYRSSALKMEHLCSFSFFG